MTETATQEKTDSKADMVGMKNISNIKQGFSRDKARTMLVDHGQGLVVSRKEWEQKYKGQKTPSGTEIWKQVPVGEVVQPELHKLKSVGESDPITGEAMDQSFIDGFKAMVGIAKVDDFTKYVNTCSSKITLQTCLTEIKESELGENEKAAIIKATVARITELS